MLKHLTALAALFTIGTAAQAESLALSSLDLTKAQQGFGQPVANHSVSNNPLSIAGQKYSSGFGTHASSLLWLDLKKSATRFTASVGVDDEVTQGTGTVEFFVYGDGKILWRSGVVKSHDPAKAVDVDLTGVGQVILRVSNGGDDINYDHADWADAKITYDISAPSTLDLPHSEAVILTPPSLPTPRINGPKLFGVRPSAPFLYSIAATGKRPMTFSAKGLPKGLSLDGATGHITGAVAKAGSFQVTLRAKNILGSTERPFKIIVGEEIQLTPPLGYNSWNCWGARVDQDKMLRSAHALVAAGLDQHGWNTINIDDAWQGARGGAFNGLQPNEKFPDIAALIKEIHGLGLKAGIYSSPWMMTYAGHQGGSSDNPEGKWDHKGAIGKYSFAQNDAKQWAAWGIDYLKYDWQPVKVEATKEMHDALRASGRDIVLSLSNNSSHTLEKDIATVGPNAELWRTSHDIFDNWESMSSLGFTLDGWAAAQRPGHFNDPDMLVVGNLFGWTDHPHPTNLTPDEQYTHISLWSLLGSPLLIGCDLETLDPFTLNLLTNDEVIDIDQDSLGKQAVRVWNSGEEKELDIYAKPLEDGSIAVGLFNRGFFAHSIAVPWQVLGLKNRHVVRDVWTQKDLGTFNNQFEATVAPHGVKLLKIIPAK